MAQPTSASIKALLRSKPTLSLREAPVKGLKPVGQRTTNRPRHGNGAHRRPRNSRSSRNGGPATQQEVGAQERGARPSVLAAQPSVALPASSSPQAPGPGRGLRTDSFRRHALAVRTCAPMPRCARALAQAPGATRRWTARRGVMRTLSRLARPGGERMPDGRNGRLASLARRSTHTGARPRRAKHGGGRRPAVRVPVRRTPGARLSPLTVTTTCCSAGSWAGCSPGGVPVPVTNPPLA